MAEGAAPDPPGVFQITTVDIDDARAQLNRFYYPIAVGAPEGVQGFALNFEVIQLGPLTVGKLDFGAPVTMVAPDLDGYHITLPVAGQVLARHAGREVHATKSQAAIFRPGRAVYTLHDAHTAELDIKIESAALEAELSAMLGRDVGGPIDLAPSMDLTAGPSQSWRRLLQLLRTELIETDSLIRRPLIAAQIRNMLLSGLLLSVPHRHLAELTAPAPPGPPRAIRRAIDAIHDEPERPFTVGDLARVAGISVRSLQEGFRRHIGSPPMAYLQLVRLGRVHDTLLRSDPARTTVAAAAHRWGFTHLGRFASAYRTKYGVTPSETLWRSS